jgi:hypothetical protein
MDRLTTPFSGVSLPGPQSVFQIAKEFRAAGIIAYQV